MEHKVIWKVRIVKPYAEAHNHLLIGHVTHRDAASLEMICRTFHYGRPATSAKDVRVGPLGKRIIPWHRVEIINELPSSFDYQGARLHADDNGVHLTDGHYHCLIVVPAQHRH